MAFIEWKEDMSVGLDALDEDHKVLIRIINSIEAGSGDEPARPEIVNKAIADLERYASFHFDREEKVMEACGYMELSNHKVAHNAFLTDLGGIARRFERNPSWKNYNQLLSYLTNWLVHHIMVQDRAYRELVENDPDALAVAQSVAPMAYEPG
jgi:hemerythrin-like metal-binding protein